MPSSRWRSVALVASVVFGVAACTGGEAETWRPGPVYDAVIRWFAADGDAGPDPVFIHVERWDDGPLDLDVQVELVTSTADDVTLRFVDARNEALEMVDDVLRVRQDGLLLRLGPITRTGGQATVVVDRWVENLTFDRFSFSLTRTAGTWTIAADPSPSGRVEIP